MPGFLSEPENSSPDGMAFLMGATLDEYFFMCPCSPSLKHRADLVVLGDHTTDHSLSLKEETIVTRHFSPECAKKRKHQKKHQRTKQYRHERKRILCDCRTVGRPSLAT